MQNDYTMLESFELTICYIQTFGFKLSYFSHQSCQWVIRLDSTFSENWWISYIFYEVFNHYIIHVSMQDYYTKLESFVLTICYIHTFGSKLSYCSYQSCQWAIELDSTFSENWLISYIFSSMFLIIILFMFLCRMTTI